MDIGKTRLDLPWNAYYDKELDVRFSRSYGPGRYDDRYELDGVDYPAGYVRWTERRNLASFLDLLANGSVDVASLISGIHPVEEAADVYDRLGAGLRRASDSCRHTGNPNRWTQPAGRSTSVHAPRPRPTPATVATCSPRLHRSGKLRHVHVAAPPAGHSAELVSVATTRSLSGLNAQRKFGFRTISTSVDTVLDDDTLDAVFIVTRHHSHAALVCQALERGLTVFVEKPLALTEEQLAEVLDTVERTGNDRVMVGFNRRFAPLVTELQERLGPSRGPVSARYLVNAGRWIRAAGTSTRSWKGRDSPVKAVISSTR